MNRPDTRPGLVVAGVDEAGRGPLAGPVFAAAVVLDPSRPIEGLDDSKVLTRRKREALFDEIRASARCFALASADVSEIDRINILQASLLAMQRAVSALAVSPDRVLVDGNRCPRLACEVEAIVDGDAKVAAISAASILAKVARDEVMRTLGERYPEYGFAQHKGYATRAHRDALARYGACPAHRRSFATVRDTLQLALPTGGVLEAAWPDPNA